MDIQINKYIFEGLKQYNNNLGDKNYGNSVVNLSPINPSYPLTIIQTIRDVANPNYNTCYGRVSSKGYKLDIFAQDMGDIPRDEIAEEVAKLMDNFMSNYVGLNRVSYNFIDLEKEGSLAHIVMTYSKDLDEYRRKFI